MTELIRDFLDPAEFYKSIQKIGVNFFCGVPDSLLKDFCAYVTTNSTKGSHVITANEGTAVAMAAGYHMATGKHPLVYLQVFDFTLMCIHYCLLEKNFDRIPVLEIL